MEQYEGPRLTIPVGPKDHGRGPADARVTLVEYGDFECPYCGAAEPMVRALLEKYPRDLRLAFRNFPLEQHPHAHHAAEAAEFAGDHGRFWEMHDRLYAHQNQLDDVALVGHARAIGLDGDALAQALRERTYAIAVDTTVAGGEASGVPGTPAFYLNETLWEDEPSVELFSEAIDWLVQNGSP